MARDALTITTCTKSAAVTKPAGLTINTTNGANVAGPLPTRKLCFEIQNTDTGAHNVTFKAGVNPPALHAGVGDLVVSAVASSNILVEIESSRFLQADGSINIDFATGLTGKVWCIQRASGV